MVTRPFKVRPGTILKRHEQRYAVGDISEYIEYRDREPAEHRSNRKFDSNRYISLHPTDSNEVYWAPLYDLHVYYTIIKY